MADILRTIIESGIKCVSKTMRSGLGLCHLGINAADILDRNLLSSYNYTFFPIDAYKVPY
jgi:hypothetical protein